MIRVLLIVILALAVICAGAVLVAVIQGKRAKKAKEEAERLHNAFWEIQKKAERLQKSLGENARIEEEADGKRKELAGAPDSGLAGRANGLFDGKG
jgi:predicted Holliday junction resolvase-like endonuclease